MVPWDTWVAQFVERATLDLGSGHVLGRRIEPRVRLHAGRGVCSRSSFFLSLCPFPPPLLPPTSPPPPFVHLLLLSLKKKKKLMGLRIALLDTVLHHMDYSRGFGYFPSQDNPTDPLCWGRGTAGAHLEGRSGKKL